MFLGPFRTWSARSAGCRLILGAMAAVIAGVAKELREGRSGVRDVNDLLRDCELLCVGRGIESYLVAVSVGENDLSCAARITRVKQRVYSMVVGFKRRSTSVVRLMPTGENI